MNPSGVRYSETWLQRCPNYHLTTPLPGGYRYVKGGHRTHTKLKEYIVTKRISLSGISIQRGLTVPVLIVLGHVTFVGRSYTERGIPRMRGYSISVVLEEDLPTFCSLPCHSYLKLLERPREA